MKRIRFHAAVLLGATLLPLPACDGIFDGIYDTYQIVTAENCESITVDGTDYTRWNYISLKTQKTTAVRILNQEGDEEPWDQEGSLPAEWDIAIHRYDVKTNGGAVLETSYASMDELLDSGSIPAGEYSEDIETTDRIAIDMSDMMNGYIIYAKSSYNEVLSRWLNVDTSTMPPIYTMSNKIYILRLQDNTHAAIHLLNYMNEKNVKGHMKFEYLYPLEKAFQ